MPGNQSRGLILASKTKGWDPTVIPARGDEPAVDLSQFDKDPTNAAGPLFRGEMPGRPPAGYPDGTQPEGLPPVPRVGAQDIFGQPTFNVPEPRENESHGVRGVLPVNGMSGTMTPVPPQPQGLNEPSSPVSGPMTGDRTVFKGAPNDGYRGGRSKPTTNANPFAGMGGQ